VIIYRYLAKEIYTSLLAVTFIMVCVFLTNQTIRWLSEAAVGNLPSNVLLKLIALQLPYLLGLLLPLGLYLGVLITYSRLYAENEMTILFSAGYSRLRLLSSTLLISILIAIVVAFLMFVINPMIEAKKSHLLEESSPKSFIGSLVPGSFQEIPGQDGVVYLEGLSEDKSVARDIFIARRVKQAEEGTFRWVVMSAKEGEQEQHNGDDFVVAKEGYRYQGKPGENNFEVVAFKNYGVKIDYQPIQTKSEKEEALSTMYLLKHFHGSAVYLSELEWRMALPISVFVLAMLAVGLSKVKPRQSRFHQLIPAIIFYIIYANFSFIAKDWVAERKVPHWLGMWWVQYVFVAIAGLILLYQAGIFEKWLFQRQKKGVL